MTESRFSRFFKLGLILRPFPPLFSEPPGVSQSH